MRNLLIVPLLAVIGGCAGAHPWVEVKSQRFTVEVADDFDERARGLMFRDRLDDDHGMLFVHVDEEPIAYWMKNTRIPLDILYFDAQRRFVSAQTRVPPCSAGDRCPNYPSSGPAKYVLELNAGTAETLNLSAGDVITFSEGIAETGQP